MGMTDEILEFFKGGGPVITEHSVGDGYGFREVYVDGKHIKTAVYANEETGVVRYLKTDEKGRYILNEKRDAAAEDEIKGKVKVKFL